MGFAFSGEPDCPHCASIDNDFKQSMADVFSERFERQHIYIRQKPTYKIKKISLEEYLAIPNEPR